MKTIGLLGGMHSAKLVLAAGADFVVICTNTIHKVAADIEAAVYNVSYRVGRRLSTGQRMPCRSNPFATSL